MGCRILLLLLYHDEKEGLSPQLAGQAWSDVNDGLIVYCYYCCTVCVFCDADLGELFGSECSTCAKGMIVDSLGRSHCCGGIVMGHR